jgi:hypothetical protein
MASFTYKFINAAIETTPNDVLVTISSFLADANGFAFLNDFNAIDVFNVLTVKSSLPTSGFVSFLSIMANKAIGDKYNKSSVSGLAVSGNPVLSSVSDTTGLVPGLFVTGDNIPTDTTLVSVRDSTSVRLSNAPTTSGTITLTFSANGWDVDYAEITRLANIVDFANL